LVFSLRFSMTLQCPSMLTPFCGLLYVGSQQFALRSQQFPF
jgi:hypothetical protein